MHESEFAPVLRHVVTRWLSLLPAEERAMKSFDILKDYFITMGEDDCPSVLWNFFSSDDTEPYLAFFQNALKVLHDAVLSLENETLLCFEGYHVMVRLTNKLKQRIDDEFLGFTCGSLIRKLPIETASLIKTACCAWYKNVLKYIETRYDFNESKLNLFKPLSLQDDTLTYASIVNIIEKLNISTFF